MKRSLFHVITPWLHTLNGHPLDWHMCWWLLGPVHTYPEIYVSASFFMRIQKYLRPHKRIRPSTHIRFVPGHLKGLVKRARAEKDWFWYCDVSLYKNIQIRAFIRIRIHSVSRNFNSGERIQKSPDTRIRRTRVDARCIRIKKFADTKISGHLWTGP